LAHLRTSVFLIFLRIVNEARFPIAKLCKKKQYLLTNVCVAKLDGNSRRPKEEAEKEREDGERDGRERERAREREREKRVEGDICIIYNFACSLIPHHTYIKLQSVHEQVVLQTKSFKRRKKILLLDELIPELLTCTQSTDEGTQCTYGEKMHFY
jgi:hypothetical protein